MSRENGPTFHLHIDDSPSIVATYSIDDAIGDLLSRIRQRIEHARRGTILAPPCSYKLIEHRAETTRTVATVGLGFPDAEDTGS